MIIQRKAACLAEKSSSSLLPCRPTQTKINIYSGPRDFYLLHMQTANPEEISIWSHLTSTLQQWGHLGFKYEEWIPECRRQTLCTSRVQGPRGIATNAGADVLQHYLWKDSNRFPGMRSNEINSTDHAFCAESHKLSWFRNQRCNIRANVELLYLRVVEILKSNYFNCAFNLLLVGLATCILLDKIFTRNIVWSDLSNGEMIKSFIIFCLLLFYIFAHPEKVAAITESDLSVYLTNSIPLCCLINKETRRRLYHV